MRATTINLYFLLLSALGLLSGLGLCSAIPALAAPVQAAEPAIHVGLPPPIVNVPTFALVPNWRVFTSAEGGFSILLPSSPTIETQVLPASKETLQFFHCHVKHQSYIVECVDKDLQGTRTLGPEEILSIFTAAVVNASRGSVISKRQLTLGKYPGREVVIKRHSGSLETQRFYLVADRFYLLTATYSPAQAGTLTTDADKFLNSFTLLPAKLPKRN